VPFIVSRLCAALTLLSSLSFASIHAAGQQSPAKAPSDLDAFMARVLERRDEAWRKLHDYVLDENERFEIVGPGGVQLHGMRREFTWYVRDGYLIRSPLRFDGVAIPEPERRRYEERWLNEEKEREAKRREKESGKQAESKASKGGQEAQARQPGVGVATSLGEFVDQRGEPRFISEAYFLQFKFEPGNYYFAGYEQLDGRAVVRIEYYPTRLFADEEHERKADQQAGAKPGEQGKQSARQQKEQKEEEEIERKMNKVALVTLWIDPAEYQIVRYTFDNVDFGFLPARWLFRLDEVSASMTMSRVLEGLWLPKQIEFHGSATLASGTYRLEYGRDFHDYRKAEIGAKIRTMVPKER
jgi:hypothetical protein